MHTHKTLGISLLFLSLLLVTILAACDIGGTGTTGGSTTPTAVQGAATPIMAMSPTATNAPPTGHTVQVTLSEFKITSSVKTFHAGVAYHFVITNAGNIDHELMIVSKTQDVETMTMDQIHKVALLIVDDVAPGATMTVNYTFPASAIGGQFEMACHFRGHYQAGMHLSIKVKK